MCCVRVHRTSSLPLQHLLSINQGLTGGPRFGCHQSFSHLRGHGGHRNAFHFHPRRVMMRHIVIRDSGLFSPLSSSNYVIFFHILASYLPLSSSQTRVRRCTTSFEDGQNIFQMTVSCPLISLTLFFFFFAFRHVRDKGRGVIFICPQLLSFFLSVCLSENILLSLSTCLIFISSIHHFFPPPCGCQFSCVFFTDVTHI